MLKIAGFDYGSQVFLTGSDSSLHVFEPPQDSQTELDKLRNRYANAPREERIAIGCRIAEYKGILAAKHRRWVRDLTHGFPRYYDVMVFETIVPGSSCKTLKDFVDFTKAVGLTAKKLKKVVITVDSHFPSSRMCSCCGFVCSKVPVRIKTWECPKCGAVHDRGFNAAVNIKREGLRMVGLSDYDSIDCPAPKALPKAPKQTLIKLKPNVKYY